MHEPRLDCRVNAIIAASIAASRVYPLDPFASTSPIKHRNLGRKEMRIGASSRMLGLVIAHGSPAIARASSGHRLFRQQALSPPSRTSIPIFAPPISRLSSTLFLSWEGESDLATAFRHVPAAVGKSAQHLGSG